MLHWRNIDAPGEPAFQGTWRHYGEPRQGARFRRRRGIVYLQGHIAGGTVGFDAGVVFVLPERFRPGANLIFASDSGNSHARVDVLTDGTVVVASGVNTCVALNAIAFPAEG